MRTLRIGNRVHSLLRQIEGKAAALLKIAPIGLEPSRATAARQEAIRNNHVAPLARCGKRTLLDVAVKTADLDKPFVQDIKQVIESPECPVP